jgi:RHH-type transcriptional regulator, rel operon repressor / antitoxin RelB
MTISFRLSLEEEARLEALARKTARSKSFYAKTALREYLTDLEDAFAADDAIKAFEAEGRRSRPLSALRTEMEL